MKKLVDRLGRHGPSTTVGASTAEDKSSGDAGPTSPLKRISQALRHKPAAPRAAELHWPDGRTSSGHLIGSGGTQFKFDLAPISEGEGPLTGSKHYERRVATIDADPGALVPDLKVRPLQRYAGKSVAPPSIQHVMPDLLTFDLAGGGAFPSDSVAAQGAGEALAKMGKRPGGPTIVRQARVEELMDVDLKLGQVMADGLADLCRRCPERLVDASAMRRAHEALSAVRLAAFIDVAALPHARESGAPGLHVDDNRTGRLSVMYVAYSAGADRHGPANSMAYDPRGRDRARGEIARLTVGDHFVLPVTVSAEAVAAGHAGLLSCTRLGVDSIKVTAINPSGWKMSGSTPTVAISKVLTDHEAEEGVFDLVSGNTYSQPPRANVAETDAIEMHLASLQPLLTVFVSMGGSGAPVRTSSQRSTPTQKGPDCHTKSKLAFLRQVLHPADYKLFKATLLMSVSKGGPPVAGLDDRMRLRLAARATSALAGHLLLAST